MEDFTNYKEMNSYPDGTYIMPNKMENMYCCNLDTTPNFDEKYYNTEYVFPNNMSMPMWNNYNLNISNYNSAPQISEELIQNQLYSTMDDPSVGNTNYGTLNLRLCNKDRIFNANNERYGNIHENNMIRYQRSDMNNNAPRINRRSDFPRNTCHAKKNFKKNMLYDKYNRTRREPPFNMDMYGRNPNRNFSCNCLYIYRKIYKNRYDVVEMKQVHSELIYLIIKYLYYERILPEANEIKRKINKYFPDCTILNNNFINICKDDILDIFHTIKNDSQEKEDKKSKNYYKKTYNNENTCIYIKGISRDFFINPNDDNENISSYIPLIFIHIIDRFRLQSNDNNHKGGRYILAETLKHTGPYIFRTMKLGRIIHILQKCIDLNILSYFNNNIIPIFTSTSISKTYVSRLHVNQTPALKSHKENSINLIKSRISYLLYSFSEDKTKSKGFSLSRLPLIYKNVYKESINIDQIGYSKLTEFINNEMSDICYISTQHKFQCILLPVMEDDQKHRDKNAKLRKEEELKKSLEYIKNYRWERCISYLHYSNRLKDMNIEFELEYNYCNPTLEKLKKDMYFYREQEDNEQGNIQNENPNNKTNDIPLLLPLDVFNLPSTYDMYDSYYKSSTYYSKDENEDKAKIKFPDNSQNKYDIMYDFKKCENTNISVEESINLNHMYYNFPSSYYVFNYLFNDYVEDLTVVDPIRIQSKT
ncbi:conserved Plasmodium protein, unknown function [Plasmodium gaboni]|uniref:HTH OST-type domain-containing protein n=1 Tax=Plasmodium gaboni TaxID=647221 RepID=A0ABY1UU69_9APIC|nr:conserved Plasmodium protein, unknown function [Plasmodium gaboni]